jgi:hypothetical protein
MAKAKSMLGSGGVVLMNEDTCMVKAALRIMRFYAHESCGWCIPCREGTSWLRKLLQRFHDGMGQRADIALIGDLAKNMLGRTFCPLGDAAALPTISIVEKFYHEFEDHLRPAGWLRFRGMVKHCQLCRTGLLACLSSCYKRVVSSEPKDRPGGLSHLLRQISNG